MGKVGTLFPLFIPRERFELLVFTGEEEGGDVPLRASYFATVFPEPEVL